MSAVLPNTVQDVWPDAALTCFHCGAVIHTRSPWRLQWKGVERAFCCAGCEAVARTIIDGGMADYYTRRTPPHNNARARPPGNDTDDWRALMESVVQVEKKSTVLVDAATRQHQSRFLIEGITCSACSWLAERSLARLAGVISAEVNFVTHVATLQWRETVESSVEDSMLPRAGAALGAIGLRLAPLDVSTHAKRAKQRRRDAWELGVALLCMMQSMMFTVPLYLAAPDEVEPGERALMNLAAMLVTMPVMIYSARRFFVGALKDLQTRRISMDVPVAIALIAIFVSSVIATLRGEGATYFDSIGMFVALLLAARWFESGVRNAAQDEIERTTSAMPSHAKVLRMIDGLPAMRREPIEAIAIGDVIEVDPGATSPVDAITLQTKSLWNEAVLSGESAPIARLAGAEVPAGAINAGEPARLRALRRAHESTVTRIATLTARLIAERRAPSPHHDAFAAWFGPLSIGLALVGGVVWLLIDVTRSIDVAIAVLAITCPCALALAAPSVMAGAHLVLARRGWLIARPAALAEAARLTHVVFDKTGTLTDGRASIHRVDTYADLNAAECLAIACGLDAGSNHPAASALLKTCQERGITPHGIEGVETVSGQGVSALWAGHTYRLGAHRFATGDQCAADQPGVWLARDGQPLACFVVGEALRDDAQQTIADLNALNIGVTMASGDAKEPVQAAAEAVGIGLAHALYRQSPDEKAALVARRAERDRVAFVGDGFNDAPAMARAHLSIAMADGAGLARNRAALVLRARTLRAIPDLIRLSRKTQSLTRQNLAWAIAYNAVAIPLALAGMVSPAIAAIGMASSSLIVIVNALRVMRVRTPGR
jgi:Cu2+-exporting ATPase